MVTTLAPTSATSLPFVRPSRHAGAPHHVQVDPASLRPLSCTCLAGTRGRLCWAVVDVAAHDLEPIAHSRWAAACGLDEIASAARLLTQVRRWAAAARELSALRSSGYVLTNRGRAAFAEAARAALEGDIQAYVGEARKLNADLVNAKQLLAEKQDRIEMLLDTTGFAKESVINMGQNVPLMRVSNSVGGVANRAADLETRGQILGARLQAFQAAQGGSTTLEGGMFRSAVVTPAADLAEDLGTATQLVNTAAREAPVDRATAEGLISLGQFASGGGGATQQVYDEMAVGGEEAAGGLRGLGSFMRGAAPDLKAAGEVAMAIPVMKRAFLAGTYLREGEPGKALKQVPALIEDLTPRTSTRLRSICSDPSRARHGKRAPTPFLKGR